MVIGYQKGLDVMQTITRKHPNVHPLLDVIDQVYALTSDHDSATIRLINPMYDKSFKVLFDVFAIFGIERYAVDLTDIHYEPLECSGDEKNLILAFSGGKDSIASAIKYKNDGYNVHLYHLKHINRSLSDEFIMAQESAKLLGMPLYVDEITLSGNNIWMEHPMKNMIIANGALSYGVREGIGTRVAFGNYTTSLLEDNVFERCAGDCMDMWDAYDDIIQRIIPDFKIMANLKNMGETLEIISEHDDLLASSISCLCRHSLRPFRNNWVKEKFGVNLSKNRCGSCYKCCVEYIYLADHDKIEFNEAYYKYCLEKLYLVTRAENTGIFSIEYLWDAYMFYPMGESKLKTIRSANMLLGGIKWDE